jgi:hypothetical protein
MLHTNVAERIVNALGARRNSFPSFSVFSPSKNNSFYFLFLFLIKKTQNDLAQQTLSRPLFWLCLWRRQAVSVLLRFSVSQTPHSSLQQRCWQLSASSAALPSPSPARSADQAAPQTSPPHACSHSTNKHGQRSRKTRFDVA